MRKRKIKPNSFQNWAIGTSELEGKIDLKKLWASEQDKEADPAVIEKLIKANEA